MRKVLIRINIGVQLNSSRTVLTIKVPIKNVQFATDNILRITLLSHLKGGNKINGYTCRYTTSSTS